MPDDYSSLEPLLPIPNRIVKRTRANDSADSRVKVGHRQASIKNPLCHSARGFCFALKKKQMPKYQLVGVLELG